MLAQDIEVPDRLFRQPVVGDDDGSLLGGAEAGDGQGRDLAAPEPLGRLQPRMAGKDGAGLVDQDRIGPNPLDAAHQPGDLVLGMASRISRKRRQSAERTPDDLLHQPPWRQQVAAIPRCPRTGCCARVLCWVAAAVVVLSERRGFGSLHCRAPPTAFERIIRSEHGKEFGW
jgi:hypothetical protein